MPPCNTLVQVSIVRFRGPGDHAGLSGSSNNSTHMSSLFPAAPRAPVFAYHGSGAPSAASWHDIRDEPVWPSSAVGPSCSTILVANQAATSADPVPEADAKTGDQDLSQSSASSLTASIPEVEMTDWPGEERSSEISLQQDQPVLGVAVASASGVAPSDTQHASRVQPFAVSQAPVLSQCSHGEIAASLAQVQASLDGLLHRPPTMDVLPLSVDVILEGLPGPLFELAPLPEPYDPKRDAAVVGPQPAAAHLASDAPRFGVPSTLGVRHMRSFEHLLHDEMPTSEFPVSFGQEQRSSSSGASGNCSSQATDSSAGRKRRRDDDDEGDGERQGSAKRGTWAIMASQLAPSQPWL